MSSFARDSLELLGCPRGQAATVQGRASLKIWLHFSPAEETFKCIKSMDAGQVFSAANIISWCKAVNPQADLTSVCHFNLHALCTVMPRGTLLVGCCNALCTIL